MTTHDAFLQARGAVELARDGGVRGGRCWRLRGEGGRFVKLRGEAEGHGEGLCIQVPGFVQYGRVISLHGRVTDPYSCDTADDRNNARAWIHG